MVLIAFFNHFFLCSQGKSLMWNEGDVPRMVRKYADDTESHAYIIHWLLSCLEKKHNL